MARAKRTDRAEARRRYRAQLAEREAVAGEEDQPSPSMPTRSAQPAREPAPPARPSITYAFRNAFRQANFREDLAYLPTLVLRTKAVWLPCLLSAASGAAVLLQPNDITALFFAYFGSILPVGSLFLAGFLAPRASYLAGMIVGAFSTVVLAVVVAAPTAAAELPAGTTQAGFIANAFVTSTIGGALVASAAAWYKRFLYLANPNRGRRPPPRGRQQPRRR